MRARAHAHEVHDDHRLVLLRVAISILRHMSTSTRSLDRLCGVAARGDCLLEAYELERTLARSSVFPLDAQECAHQVRVIDVIC